MKKKIFSFAAAILFCFSLLSVLKPQAKASANEYTQPVQTIDVGSSTFLERNITDASKRYILTGTSTNRDVTIENTSLIEQTFYIEIDSLFMTNTNYYASIIIRDNGHITNVYFYLKNVSKIINNFYGGITIAAADGTSGKVNVVFASNGTGSLEIETDENGTQLGAPAIDIKENVEANLSINTKNSAVNQLSVSGTGYDSTEISQAFETAATAGNRNFKIKLSKLAKREHKVDFNLMNHGENINSIYISETDGKITLPVVQNVDGFRFVGWFKDQFMRHQWNEQTDTVTKDITLYACWEIVPPQKNIPEANTLPTYAIVLIALGSAVVATLAAYVILYFAAYKRNKFVNKFTKTIYKPFNKKLPKEETKETPKAAKKTTKTKNKPSEKTEAKPEKQTKKKAEATKTQKTEPIAETKPSKQLPNKTKVAEAKKSETDKKKTSTKKEPEKIVAAKKETPKKSTTQSVKPKNNLNKKSTQKRTKTK